jgi:aryl-alcohol dehydrogenase-like predicted oxidoreductase
MSIDGGAGKLTRRRIGRTAMDVTTIGCGGVAIGSFHAGEEIDDDAAVAVIHSALAAGINYLDTSPLYRESERRFGLALRALGGPPAGLFLSTKTGTHPTRPYDYSGEATRWSVENSLALLGVESVDMVLVHDPRSMDPVLAAGGAVTVLEQMRAEGKLRAIGLGCRSHEFHRQAIRSGRFDAILTFADFNLIRQTAADLIDEAKAAGVGVLVAQVLAAGQLAGGDPLEHPRLKARPEATAAHEWWAWARDRGVPLQALATQFVLRNPNVDCVLIGPRTAAEATENVALATLPIDDTVWAEVDRRVAASARLNV